MKNIVGVRFRNAGKIYYFDPLDFEISKDDKIIVETARGIEFGNVVVDKKEIDETTLNSPLKAILRVATKEDIKINEEN